jgi:hypothetical protein
MTTRRDEFRRQINDVWKHAIGQLEDVKEAVLRSTDRLEDVKEVVARGSDRVENELGRLRQERDKLLKKLGEQTYKLANQGSLPVPSLVKQTVDRLNEVIDKMVEKGAKESPKTRRKKTTKKDTGKKRTSTRKTKR